MGDALVYGCDDSSCYWNHGQACTTAQIDLNEEHKCAVYILRELAEQAIAEHMKVILK